MKYKTLKKKITAASIRMNKAAIGKHDYKKAIEALSATKEVCRLTIIFLKQCEADGIPFNEYEIKLAEKE